MKEKSLSGSVAERLKASIFITTPIAWFKFNPLSGHVVMYLDVINSLLFQFVIAILLALKDYIFKSVNANRITQDCAATENNPIWLVIDKHLIETYKLKMRDTNRKRHKRQVLFDLTRVINAKNKCYKNQKFRHSPGSSNFSLTNNFSLIFRYKTRCYSP